MDGTELLSIGIDQITRQLKFFAADAVWTFILSGVNMSRIFQ